MLIPVAVILKPILSDVEYMSSIIGKVKQTYAVSVAPDQPLYPVI